MTPPAANPIASSTDPLGDPDEFARLVATCERMHRQQIPLTEDALVGELVAPGGGQYSRGQVRAMLASPRLERALVARGVSFSPTDQLTAHQLHALSIYMDTSVPMTHRERLRNARVTQKMWDGWMRNPRFMAALEEISEDRLRASTPLTHLRLLEAVDAGERWAIEMHYQITGRFNASQGGSDPTELFAAIFQVLDDAGVPGEVLARVGKRMREVASPGSAPARAAAVMLTPGAAPSPRPPAGPPDGPIILTPEE